MWVCIILVYVCMYVYTWRSVIFSLFRMKTLLILEGRENMDPSSGKNNQSFFFYEDVEEEFLFLLYTDLGCCLDKSSFLLFPQTCTYSVLLGYCPLTLIVYLHFLSTFPKLQHEFLSMNPKITS